MTKEYYNIKCKDGIDRQVWDIERELAFASLWVENQVSIKQGSRFQYAFLRFCDAFEYVARAGRKDSRTKEEDIAKAKDNLQQIDIEDKNFLLYLVDKLYKITEIGEELKKLIDETYEKQQ